ncbi:hypothetical protein GQ457_06G030360 [Hibiscus cannabinus]
MGINHFTLTLISLSCLFSFSFPASTNAATALVFEEMFDVKSQSPSSLSSDGVTLGSIDDLTSVLPDGIDPALEQICEITDHPVECIVAAITFLDEKAPIEPLSVLKAGIQAMDNQTREALEEVTKLSLDPTTPRDVVPVLEKCREVYNAILISDQKSYEAIDDRNLVRLSTELGANVENALGCDDAFREAKVESPMKAMDALLGKIINNSLSIGFDMAHFWKDGLKG